MGDFIQNLTYVRNSYIGFDKEEIRMTPTADLITIRKAVLGYIRSTKLKKRNVNFLEVYKRINSEIKEREVNERNEQQIFRKRYLNSDILFPPKGNICFSNENDLLLRKRKSFDFDEFPDFLNDKEIKTEKKVVNEGKFDFFMF